jgi:putative SOS response-associated peptidase YedK
MPAILMPDEFDPWVQEGDKAVLAPCHPDLVAMHPVSKRVNTPKNDDEALIEAA